MVATQRDRPRRPRWSPRARWPSWSRRSWWSLRPPGPSWARWIWPVVAATGLGLVVRLAAVLARPHLAPGGDAFQYWAQANLLAEGKGFIEPLVYATSHRAVQTASLPPLYIMVLAVCSLVGFKSFLAHRIWSAMVGAAAVPLAALVGRDIAGPRTGLLAALVVAISPNL